MNTWPQDELARIAASDDLHIALFREEGKTYGMLARVAEGYRVTDERRAIKSLLVP